MIYLNVEKTICADVNEEKIYFNNNEKELDLSKKQSKVWKLFWYLLKNESQGCSIEELAKELSPDRKVIDADKLHLKTTVSDLRKALNDNNIPCNGNDSNDLKKISISSQKGYYMMTLPRLENETEKILTKLFWDRYEKLSVQKDGELKRDEVTARLGDVYQFPLMQEGSNEVKLKIKNFDLCDNNLLIEAPNGYGKTTFMKSILLGSNYIFREGLTDDAKEKYENIKYFYGIDESYLCIYLECKNIEIDTRGEYSGIDWLYDNLSHIESIRIDRHIDKKDFSSIVKKYSIRKKLILLMDGLDEIKADKRPKLIKFLDVFQKNDVNGCNSRVIMSTRPLFWEISFNGYRRYMISNRNIIEDKKIFLKYVTSYARYYKLDNIEKMYEYVINNYYLNKMVCSPATIVWIIREYCRNSNFFVSMERIIEQMMLRYNSRELTIYKEQYKRVYEELAFSYLCLAETEEGINCLEEEMLSIIRGCIEKIEKEGKQEGGRKFKQLFKDSKTDEELGELFFTNVALMEYMNGRIKFSNPIFAYHLAARKVLRSFRERDNKNVCDQLNQLPYKWRYYVIVISVSIAPHLNDLRFAGGFGENVNDIPLYAGNSIYKYLYDRWNDAYVTEEEKHYILEAIEHIMSDSYGQNVYTMSGEDNRYKIMRAWMQDKLKSQE